MKAFDSSHYTKYVLWSLFIFLIFTMFSSCDKKSSPKQVPIIAAIQNEIALADKAPQAYYKKNYAPVEPLYWSKIAGWMIEDWIERNNIRKQPAIAILDIGCGYGTLLSYAARIYGAEGTCMDVVQYLQPKVMSQYDLSFITGNVEKDTMPAGIRYDVIIMTEVLEHLNFQPVPTLKKICASLNEGGAFFLSTPDADGGWGRVTKYYASLGDIPAVDPAVKWIDDHIWQYNQVELEKVLHEAGFDIRRLDRSDGIQGKHFNVWAVKGRDM